MKSFCACLRKGKLLQRRVIPKFFCKKSKERGDSLFRRVRQEARTRFWPNKTSEGLEKEDLEKLWYLLKENVSQPDDGTQRIS